MDRKLYGDLGAVSKACAPDPDLASRFEFSSGSALDLCLYRLFFSEALEALQPKGSAGGRKPTCCSCWDSDSTVLEPRRCSSRAASVADASAAER